MPARPPQLFRVAARTQQELGLASLPPTLVYTTRTIQATAAALASQLAAQEQAGGAGDGGGAGGQGPSVPAIRPHCWDGPRRPLSANQVQMWMLQQAGLGAAYNMQVAMGLRGAVDREALQSALDFILERHEVLR